MPNRPGTVPRCPTEADWHFWRERRLPRERVHLDSAAAGQASVGTLRAAARHAEREVVLGAYVAQAEAAPVLGEGQAALAGLLGVPVAGLAFVENAHVALDLLLRTWPLADGDVIAVVPSEWGPNLHAFARRGLSLTEIGVDAGGVVDLADLERVLDTLGPALVHITQVASHRPLVQPVAEAAAVCRAAGVPLWVDAAQSIGHVNTACGADAIYATSRKWLAGPRGVGMLGVAEPWWDKLEIDAPELQLSGQPADASPVWLLQSAEAHIAGRIGLCHAVQEFIEAGPERVWRRLAEVGRQTREALAGLPGWSVVAAAGPSPAGSLSAGSPSAGSPSAGSLSAGSPGVGSATTALRATAGQDIAVVRARLLDEHGIVTSVCGVPRAPREMTEPLLRVSPHVDCTPDDLDLLRNALQAVSR
ncbi:MAG: aminotransferase class V-fold PLP-dependent enzyme [Streptosporangiaceae bacterium]|nr:aminotransferase class V-fold PLP-dependent enzyme [Streptosporangiaceae bacterium]